MKGWYFALRVVWVLVALSFCGLFAAIWREAVIWPYIALSMFLLVLVALLEFSVPGIADDQQKGKK